MLTCRIKPCNKIKLHFEKHVRIYTFVVERLGNEKAAHGTCSPGQVEAISRMFHTHSQQPDGPSVLFQKLCGCVCVVGLFNTRTEYLKISLLLHLLM